MHNQNAVAKKLVKDLLSEQPYVVGHEALCVTFASWSNATVASTQNKIAMDWLDRCKEILTTSKEETPVRFPPPVSTDPGAAISAITDHLLLELRVMNINEGLDFMADITAYWLQSFHLASFFEKAQNLGYQMPQENLEAFVINTALWFIALDFQLE